MKTLLLALLILQSGSAFALKNGDFSILQTTVGGQALKIKFTATDVESDKFIVKVEHPGGSEEITSITKAQYLATAEELRDCAVKSAPENETTAPAGKFLTCHKTQEGVELYLNADVLMFNVKQVAKAPNGEAVISELIEYKTSK